jgi:hypothetical protein
MGTETTPFRDLHPAAKCAVIVICNFLAVIAVLLLVILVGWLWGIAVAVWSH